jgi:CheY-like chemotaxis protein
MTGPPRENEIEMERRHIRETKACIARQEEVVVRLDLMGAVELALKAREPLVGFYEFLAIARARLVHLEEKWSANAPQSNQDATDTYLPETRLTARIHIIDNDDAVRNSTHALLQSYGYEVYEHASAEQFLPHSVSEADCLLIDQHMPGMTGLELLEHLRANGNRTPAIMITGREDQTLRPRAERIGVKMLNKPLVPEQLLSEIEQARHARS